MDGFASGPEAGGIPGPIGQEGGMRGPGNRRSGGNWFGHGRCWSPHSAAPSAWTPIANLALSGVRMRFVRGVPGFPTPSYDGCGNENHVPANGTPKESSDTDQNGQKRSMQWRSVLAVEAILTVAPKWRNARLVQGAQSRVALGRRSKHCAEDRCGSIQTRTIFWSSGTAARKRNGKARYN